jgi:transcriptional regulator with GAF, ATPase, and Fis domain
MSPRPALVPTYRHSGEAPGISAQVSKTEHPEVGPEALLELQSTVFAQADFRVAASAFATEFALLMQAERAAIGFLRRGQTRIVALSHSTHFKSGAEQLALIAAAMDEAIEQEASIAWPEAAGARPHITAAHAALARRDGTSLATIPLAVQGRAFGALSVLRRGNAPFNMHEIAQCERIAAAIGPVLQLKLDAERPWIGRLLQGLRAAVKTWWSRDILHSKRAPALPSLPLRYSPSCQSIIGSARLPGSRARYSARS